MPEADRSELLEVRIDSDARSTVIAVVGEVDMTSVHQLEGALEHAAARAEGAVVLDLHAVTFMDVSGLRAILWALERLGPRLELRDPSRQVTRLFSLLHFEGFLQGAAQAVQRARSAQSNVEFVRAMWDAFVTGGIEAMIDLVPDDMAWSPTGAPGRRLVGAQDVSAYWGPHMPLPLATEFTAAGDDVIVRFELSDDAEAAHHRIVWGLYRFDGHRLLEAVSFDSLADALRY